MTSFQPLVGPRAESQVRLTQRDDGAPKGEQVSMPWVQNCAHSSQKNMPLLEDNYPANQHLWVSRKMFSVAIAPAIHCKRLDYRILQAAGLPAHQGILLPRATPKTVELLLPGKPGVAHETNKKLSLQNVWSRMPCPVAITVPVSSALSTSSYQESLSLSFKRLSLSNCLAVSVGHW